MPNKVMVVDTHCHVAHLRSDHRVALAEARKAGVGTVVDIAMGLAESEAAIRRAEASNGTLFASIGLHPNDLEDFSPDAMERLRSLAGSPSVVAFGETGLDFYRDHSPRELQEDAFRAHIALAKECDKALVIHCRDAHDRVLEVLDAQGAPDRVVMHCFSGDVGWARRCASLGYFCSFAGNLTYKRNEELREAARAVPAELLLVETDAPYLAPHPHRGKPNTPAYLPYTGTALAEARAEPPEVVFESVAANARRAFGLP